MPKRLATLCGVLATATICAPAIAQDASRARSFRLPAQPLATSLQTAARTFGIDLLFVPEEVRGRSAPAISGRLRIEQALSLLLAGSGLTARRTDSGSFIVTQALVTETDQPEAIPDILVIGRRTQNADIRRTRNDVRPYQVLTRQQIASSHAATVEELAARRLPANAQDETLGQLGASARGETASSINLRGLGTAQTLVLIDGRRLPQMPSERADYLQGDVNGLAPEAIERVEAITATAGGVYGPGATAGVVNLVLKRDYRGLEGVLTSGVTARGDAPYRRASLRLGFTPDAGATDVMISFTRSDFGGLDAGDRDLEERRNARIQTNDPSYFLANRPPPSPSLNVTSADRRPLVFKPAYGGASLGAATTFAPLADGRSRDALVDILRANAGQLDLTPAANAAGGGRTLLSSRRTGSIIASARHQAGGIELFVDYLRLTNEGRARSANSSGLTALSAANPANPFTTAINVYAPDPELAADFRFRTSVRRLTGGLIVDLPAGWRASADYSTGSGERRSSSQARAFTEAGIIFDVTQRFAGGGVLDPLGDYSTYGSAFAGLIDTDVTGFRQRNQFHDATLRLAGPILTLSGGPLSVTLLTESRSERVRGGISSGFSAVVGPIPDESLPAYGQRTRSLYGELRLPLMDAISGWRALRGLEVQLALRHDRADTSGSENLLSRDGGGSRTVRNAGLVYTAGLKFSPLDGLLVRGSISSGEQPLTPFELSRIKFVGLGFTDRDPQRPGERVYTFDEISGGPANPRTGAARSVSVGIVFQPESAPGLRASIDYTRIARWRENVSTVASGADYFIANEAIYPDRVKRLPLTAADAALGYTAGRITQVDRSSLQNGRTEIEAVDVQIDHRFSLPQQGSIDLHGAFTWQPRFIREVGFGVPARNFRDAIGGALALRGNGGVSWSTGSLTLSADVQFTGGYRITSPIEFLQNLDAGYVLRQGSSRIPAQATIDLGSEIHLTLPERDAGGRRRTLDLRFGIQNALDTRPATVVNATGGYNPFLDPRRRRFELSAALAM